MKSIMWNCNWGYPSGPGNWFFGHGIFGMLFSILLVIAIIYLIIFVVRLLGVKDKSHKDRNDSMEILKARYAGGEISEEEYIRMRDILTS